MWYAIFVETGEEDNVKTSILKHIRSGIMNCLVPKRLVPEKKQGIVRDALQLLFPGYVLIQTTLTPELYYQIRNIPQVNYIVFSGEHKKDQSMERFSPIPDREMEWILKLSNPMEVITYSDVVKLNAQVKVISGPLTGKEAIIRKIDKRKRRAKVEINFLGEKRLIELGINVLNEVVT